MANAVAKALMERRANVVNELQALVDRVGAENRAFTAEEEQTYQRMNAELDALASKVQGIVDAEKRDADIEAAFAARQGRGQTPEAKDRDAEIRAFIRGERGRELTVMPERRDLTAGTATDGAELVPQGFYGRLVEHMVEASGVLQANPTIVNTASGNPLDVPKTTAHSSAALITEGGSISESDPQFGTVTLGAYKYGFTVQVSSELLQDESVDLTGYLARQSGGALGRGIGADLVVGTGTSEPQGVSVGASVGITLPNAAGLVTSFGDQATVDEGGDIFINLYHSVIPEYRASSACYWMMNDATAAEVRKLKNSQGDYVWQPSLVVGNPDTILGKPVVIDPNMADLAASARTVLFGDFSAYFVRLAGGIRFERSDDFAFTSDLVTFRALQRADGRMVDTTGAVKALVMAAS